MLLKCLIYNCKFQDKPLNFDGFKALWKCNNEIKYFIAKKETNLLFISKSGEAILILKIYYSKTYVKHCFEYSSTCTYWLHCLCLLLLCDLGNSTVKGNFQECQIILSFQCAIPTNTIQSFRTL